MAILPLGGRYRQERDDPRARAAASWRVVDIERAMSPDLLTLPERVARLERRLDAMERSSADG